MRALCMPRPPGRALGPSRTDDAFRVAPMTQRGTTTPLDDGIWGMVRVMR